VLTEGMPHVYMPAAAPRLPAHPNVSLRSPVIGTNEWVSSPSHGPLMPTKSVIHICTCTCTAVLHG
jgi:hypothetical protein